MINIENEIIDAVYKAVSQNHPGATVSSVYIKSVPSFPHVHIYEMDNATEPATVDNSHAENHAMLTYEVNVYSNLKSGAKAECRAIAATVDETLLALGFRRLSLQLTPNLEDATISRMTGRYSVVAGKDHILYYRS